MTGGVNPDSGMDLPHYPQNSMQFGYIADDGLLDRIDFTLPPDDAGNASVLRSGLKPPVPDLYLGCAEYRVREWSGLVYPPRTKEAAMLACYSKQFRVLEMNGTHYRIYPAAQIAKWAGAVDRKDFLFLPKFPKSISHESHSFGERQELTAAFLGSVAAFSPHLGPLFLQMSDGFGVGNRRDFFAYLGSLPEGPDYFVELRHPDWFNIPEVRQELLAALRTMGIGLVITDTPGRREVCHMALTIPKVMIRFVGRHRHAGMALRIADWAQRLRAWMDAGLEEAHFIVHTGLSAPLTAACAIPVFNAALGTEIPIPELLATSLPE